MVVEILPLSSESFLEREQCLLGSQRLLQLFQIINSVGFVVFLRETQWDFAIGGFPLGITSGIEQAFKSGGNWIIWRETGRLHPACVSLRNIAGFRGSRLSVLVRGLLSSPNQEHCGESPHHRASRFRDAGGSVYPIEIRFYEDAATGVAEATSITLSESIDSHEFPAIGDLPECRAAGVAGADDRLHIVAKTAAGLASGIWGIEVIAEDFTHHGTFIIELKAIDHIGTIAAVRQAGIAGVSITAIAGSSETNQG
jgi:hypothetical protein